jgi:protein-disulfide isomerase
MRIEAVLVGLWVGCAWPGLSLAGVPACDKLQGEQQSRAQELLNRLHPYDCCDDTLAVCLREKPVCSLVQRLAGNICRRVADGQPADKIERALSRRARSMSPEGKQAAIDLDGFPQTGDPAAPVLVVEYACARCPYCAKITPALVRALTQGVLKGKARLVFKPFPIRSHEFSKETGLGFMAAIHMGKFWEFMLYSYAHFDSFCIKKQAEWAEAAGLDKEAFEKLVNDAGLRDMLIKSKKEGLRNGVDATPTFFIDGRQFFGDMDIEELIDVLEEEADRLAGVEYLK